jgi:hypothetical protein
VHLLIYSWRLTNGLEENYFLNQKQYTMVLRWCNLPLPWPDSLEGDLLLLNKKLGRGNRTCTFYSTVGEMHFYSRMLGRLVFLPPHSCTSYCIAQQVIAVQLVLSIHHHDSTIAVFATIATTR